MELADCGSPDALVVAILKQVPDMPVPIPIEEIARQLDIIDIRALETDNFEGGLIAFEDKSRGTILVNEKSPRQRQRFTVGHELGHFLIPTHKPKDEGGFRCSSKDMRQNTFKPADRAVQMEVEANRFAAGLLMPPEFFRKDLARLRGADIEHIIRLAKRYDTSKEATARRYVDSHDELCAVIVSRGGKVLRMYRPSSFPFIETGHGQPIPTQSLTARFNPSNKSISEWHEMDGSVWLSTQYGHRAPTVYEQVLTQSNGFRLTLLNVEASSDSEEEDEDLADSWTPRFHKR
jgi:Zn-dependent peptidase ImmA (M78 family)